MEKKAVVGNLMFIKVFRERLTLINAGNEDGNQLVALFIPKAGGNETVENVTIQIEQNFCFQYFFACWY